MEGKNTGAVVFILLFIMFCAIIGSCFMAFVFPTKQIKVNNPAIVTDAGIVVKNENGEDISTLNLSTSKLGLKPVTGEEDDTYSIPLTVTDSQGSEGLYGKFYLSSSQQWKLFITDVNIEGGASKDERKHVKVGLKNVEESSQTLEQDKTLIASGDAVERKEFTLFVWLHPSAGDSLVGSTISFKLTFEVAE